MAACTLLAQSAQAARYADTTNYWSEKYIDKLSEKGQIPTATDGKFRPSDPITRAELAQWLVNVLGIDKQPVASTPSFPDVKPTDPYFRAVEIIRQNNYISGYSDGFRPKQFIQRGEMITILSRTLNAPKPDDGAIDKELSRFTDGSTIPQWARQGIAMASREGILILEAQDKVNAKGIATKGEAAAMLCALDELLTQQAVSDARRADPNQQSGATTPYPAYQGQVQQQAYGQPPYGGGAPGYPTGQPPVYLPNGYPPPGGYPLAAGTGQFGYTGGPVLQGAVSTIAAGTAISGSLKNSIDSGSTQIGEPVEVTLPTPVGALPAGTTLIGNVTNVVSAARFKFGANGKVEIKFSQCLTPDGRRIPLSGSIDTNQIRLTGGTMAGRVGKGAVTTAVGAGSGAALGTALGAIVGATSRGRVGKATGMGAVFGTAIGGGVGLVGAGVRKGSEVKIPAGTNIPITIDQTFQISAPAQFWQPIYSYPTPPQGGIPYQPPIMPNGMQ